MSKEKCKHEKWNFCGNNFYSCSKCGILRTSQQINIYAEKDQQIAQLKAENERLKKYETIYYLNQLQASNEDIDKFKQNQIQQSINISDLLKENTKQVRKEVCEELRKYYTTPIYDRENAHTDVRVLLQRLDQIQGETKDS